MVDNIQLQYMSFRRIINSTIIFVDIIFIHGYNYQSFVI